MSSYYRGAHGFFICVDLTNRDSFTTDLLFFKSEIAKYANNSNHKIVILGTKCDLREEIVIQREELEELAKEWGIPYLEVSSKADLNIDKALLTLVQSISPPSSPSTKPIPKSSSTTKSSSKCEIS